MFSEKNAIINELDQVVRWPKKPKDKEFVINFLSTKFDLTTEIKSLENKIHEITIDKEISLKARRAVERMMEIGR